MCDEWDIIGEQKWSQELKDKVRKFLNEPTMTKTLDLIKLINLAIEDTREEYTPLTCG